MHEVLREDHGIAIEKGIPFTEDFKMQRGRMVFTAESHAEWMKGLFPDVPQGEYREELSEDITMSTIMLPVTREAMMGIFYGFSKTRVRCCLGMPESTGSEVAYDNPVWILRLTRKGRSEPFMSLTPMEVYTLRSGVKRAKGKVLMCGLGMGWMARRVLERKQVTHLTVIDKEGVILKRFGEPLKKKFGDKLSLLEGDAYEMAHPQKNLSYDYDIALWDIWDDYSDASFDRRFQEVRRLAPVWNWGRKYSHLQY